MPHEKIDGYLKDMLNKCKRIQPIGEETRDLYPLANNVPFDDRVNHFAELNDLNITLIQQYLREVGSSLYAESGQMDFAELRRNMNLISTLPEYIKPENVGLMFFSLEPEKFFTYVKIDVVQFTIFETDEERTYFLTTFPIYPEFTASSEAVNKPA